MTGRNRGTAPGSSSGGGRERPLTARSVLLSTLLGSDPPVLATRRLVATAALFGITDGAARVALSRMAAAGEVAAEGGSYRLRGRLLDRRARLVGGRRPALLPWDGAWRQAVVLAGGRSAAARGELRTVLVAERLAELREGTWLRPANLPPAPVPTVVAQQCRLLVSRLDGGGDAELAAALWDLDGWAAEGEALRRRLATTSGALEAGDLGALAPGFVLSAAVLRLLAADPLLPDVLLPSSWPGEALRDEYDAWDAAYRSLLADWHRSQDEG